MEFGINLMFCEREGGLALAAQQAAKAGFTMLDYTPHLREDWEEQTEKAMAIFADCGLKVHQTHAPFNRYGTWGDRYGEALERCALATEKMGAEYMVVHGDEFDFKTMEFSPEAALEYNRRIFLPYVERAERNGYKVAFETVFDDMGLRRYTSQIEELIALIDSFESEAAVCCWDFGHAKVSFRKKQAENIRQMGSRIQCTHLHDNSGVDAHQIPMTGDIPWHEVMEAFREIGYRGVMSVEYAHGSLPGELMQDFLNFTYRAAKAAWEA